MSLSISSDFLFGVIVGGLLVVAGQPLLRSLSKVSRFIPVFVVLGLLGLGLFLWMRG
jgi:hypothetical protein